MNRFCVSKTEQVKVDRFYGGNLCHEQDLTVSKYTRNDVDEVKLQAETLNYELI